MLKSVVMKGLYLALLTAFFFSCQNTTPKANTWSSYHGGKDRNHYSELNEINPSNVAQLEPAWSFTTSSKGQMQMNPIVVDSMVYIIDASLRVYGLHAESGKEIWSYGANFDHALSTSRGVSYWKSKKGEQRIFYTRNYELIALNALSGKPAKGFGVDGSVDIRKALPSMDKWVISNTPGTIFKDLIILPLRVSESEGAAKGNIIAFDTNTGAVVWTFETLPSFKDNPNVGGGNNWAGMSLDEEKELLYIPTGSASPDFYGANRIGKNEYANSVIALDANTGNYVWHFQTVHHDLWDRDLPAPPNLIQIEKEGKSIDALAQISKQGYVFLFDRANGTPIYDIEETKVPQSNIPNEISWETQPIPSKPKAFARQIDELKEAEIGMYSKRGDSLKKLFKSMIKQSYHPPDTSTVLLFPGYDGGGEWGGAAAVPDEGLLYVNSNEMAWELRIEKKEIANTAKGLYTRYCSSCHLDNFQGVPESGYPSLVNISERLTTEELHLFISNGKGRMPGFSQLPKEEIKAISRYVMGLEDGNAALNTIEPVTTYIHSGYQKFLDENGLPAINPPWGQLHAIDLNTATYKWSVPLGETPGIGETGTENYGGPLVTKNGLLFIAATKDGFIRAFDRHTGEVLWKYKLPYPAFASPSLYQYNNRSYLVIACGGEKLGTVAGDQIIAFALPQ